MIGLSGDLRLIITSNDIIQAAGQKMIGDFGKNCDGWVEMSSFPNISEFESEQEWRGNADGDSC